MFLGLPSFAEGACERSRKIDIEDPVYSSLLGCYEIIGRIPGSSETYSGTLKVEFNKAESHYILTRTVKGKTITGDAWLEVCSDPDVRLLRFEYKSKPLTYIGNCYFHWGSEYDNFISCYTGYSEKEDLDDGLESMFQIL